MKTITKLGMILWALLFGIQSTLAVPVKIENNSNDPNSPSYPIYGGYIADVHLGVRPPNQDCQGDAVISFTLNPGEGEYYDGQWPYGGTCVQDYFWGISCSDTSYEQFFPGLRFATTGVEPQHYISGITRDLLCEPDHIFLIPDPEIETNWRITNQGIPGYDVDPDKVILYFIDFGFYHHYIFV